LINLQLRLTRIGCILEKELEKVIEKFLTMLVCRKKKLKQKRKKKPCAKQNLQRRRA
jgi:hypothetical protein